MDNSAPYLSIKHWSDDDRPREKLALKGKEALSKAELIAILLGSGSKNESAVRLAQRILASIDHNLIELGKLSIDQLTEFKGVGPAKAITIAAAMELARRQAMEMVGKLDSVNDSLSAYKILNPILGHLPHEEFWVLFLNNSNKVVHKGQISKGGITGTLVDVRLVMKTAIQKGSVALILAHNHPSGTLKASKADKDLTTKLKASANILDIRVLDHLILAHGKYMSFADEGLL